MMKLRLSWTDPVSQRPRRPLLNAPIALGRAFEAMPREISGQSVSRMVIGDRQIQDFQALLVEVEGELYLIDNGGQTYVNQQPISGQERLSHGDRICIGHTELQLQILDALPSAPGHRSTHLQAVPELAIEFNNSVRHAAVTHAAGSPAGNGNGTPGVHRGDASQVNLPPVDVTHPDPNVSHHRNGQLYSRNGNGPAQPQPVIIPEPDHSSPPAPHGAPPGDPASPATPAQPLRQAHSSPNAGCRRMVGFLFKRPCGRTNSAGCDHCANGGYSSHAYRADYDLYEGFGRFEPGDWGYGLLENQEKR